MKVISWVDEADKINTTPIVKRPMMPHAAPVWAKRGDLLARYPVPVRWLDKAVADGFIRTVKFGTQKQSARLYRVADVENAIEKMAVGRSPQVVAVKA